MLAFSANSHAGDLISPSASSIEHCAMLLAKATEIVKDWGATDDEIGHWQSDPAGRAIFSAAMELALHLEYAPEDIWSLLSLSMVSQTVDPAGANRFLAYLAAQPQIHEAEVILGLGLNELSPAIRGLLAARDSRVRKAEIWFRSVLKSPLKTFIFAALLSKHRSVQSRQAITPNSAIPYLMSSMPRLQRFLPRSIGRGQLANGSYQLTFMFANNFVVTNYRNFLSSEQVAAYKKELEAIDKFREVHVEGMGGRAIHELAEWLCETYIYQHKYSILPAAHAGASAQWQQAYLKFSDYMSWKLGEPFQDISYRYRYIISRLPAYSTLDFDEVGPLVRLSRLMKADFQMSRVIYLEKVDSPRYALLLAALSMGYDLPTPRELRQKIRQEFAQLLVPALRNWFVPEQASEPPQPDSLTEVDRGEVPVEILGVESADAEGDQNLDSPSEPLTPAQQDFIQDDFTPFIQGQVAISELRSDRSYEVRFLRGHAGLLGFQQIQFSDNAVKILAADLNAFGASSLSWLRAIRMGIARADNQRGIKFLRDGLGVEVKVMESAFRLKGRRISGTSWLFERFENDH